MGRDNKDRYGYRHREDSEYGLGESKPGDVGDSKGTFFDRASADNNVIVEGEVQNYETHQRNKTSEEDQEQQSGPSTERSKSASELRGEVVEVEVERISGSGNPIGSYQGKHVYVPRGEPGQTYEVELTPKSGYFVGKIRTRE